MKTINYLKIGILGLIVLATISSCSIATEQVELTQETQSFVFTDVTEGSNMAQVEVTSATTFYNQEGISAENIQKATITSIEISKNDSLSFSEIESATFQIVGDENDMVSVALINPIPKDSKKISLEFSEEVDITPYIKEGVFQLVLDVSFKTDDFENEKNITADIKYNLETTK